MDTERENTLRFARALCDSVYFAQEMVFLRLLGAGADGEVNAWEHWPTGRIVAIKTPHTGSERSANNIKDEAEVLNRLRWHGGHHNIANMLQYHENSSYVNQPAIISEFAEYGDLLDFRHAFVQQEIAAGRPGVIPEATVWKLFRDMVLALDWLHLQCKFIHRDIKPENILVTRPLGYTGELIPAEPLFKLADFSRSWDMMVPSGPQYRWEGTVAYRPRAQECQAARPASDLWSLGATLQDFALGMNPIPSRAAVIAQLDLEGRAHPRFQDETAWADPYWQWAFGAVYRPLNASADDLLRTWDVGSGVASSHRPFSNELNTWYTTLFLRDYKRRVTARTLARHMVPVANSHLVTTTNRVDSAMNPQAGNSQVGNSQVGNLQAGNLQGGAMRRAAAVPAQQMANVARRDPNYEENFPALPAANQCRQ